MRAYSVDLRERIVEAVKRKGLSKTAAAELYGVSRATVYRYLELAAEGSLAAKVRPGQLPRLDGVESVWWTGRSLPSERVGRPLTTQFLSLFSTLSFLCDGMWGRSSPRLLTSVFWGSFLGRRSGLKTLVRISAVPDGVDAKFMRFSLGSRTHSGLSIRG